MQSFRFGKPLPDQVDFSSRRGNSALGLLLKRVQDLHSFFKANGVNSAPGPSALFRYDLQHGRAAESFQRLRTRIGLALLRRIERGTDFMPHRLRKRAYILPG
jgi:hypothetical protein